MSYFILALAFTAFVFVVICMLTKSSSTTITTTTPNVLSQNIITFNSVPGVDYSTMENVEKTFTLGTFVAELVLDSLSFNFNTSNSVFDNSYVGLVIIDSNDNEIFNKLIEDFAVSPIAVPINKLYITKESRVVLKIGGMNTRLISPSITFTFKLPSEITTTPLVEFTTMPPTPTTIIKDIIFSPTNNTSLIVENNTSLIVENNIQSFNMGTFSFSGLVKNIQLSYDVNESAISLDSFISIQILNSLEDAPLYTVKTTASELMDPYNFKIDDNLMVFSGQIINIVLIGSSIKIYNPSIRVTIESSIIPSTTMMPTTMMPTTMRPMETMMPTTMYPTTMMPTTMRPMETTMRPMETTMMPTTMMPTTMRPTTMRPTTMRPMETMMPTTMYPMETTMQPMTMMPTMYPTTMQPATMMPTTMYPMETTMYPTTMQPTTMQPTTMMPTTMYPMKTTMYPMETTMMPTTMYPMKTTMYPMETTMMPTTMQPTTMYPMKTTMYPMETTMMRL